jgi:hypothetical protein
MNDATNIKLTKLHRGLYETADKRFFFAKTTVRFSGQGGYKIQDRVTGRIVSWGEKNLPAAVLMLQAYLAAQAAK